ncbi:MAG: hypothetical protein OJF59_000612 [Cytophagales bacterium]|jgi:uncharacterized protein YifN (PemK superfamily)|nr:MAG: hypothetical protein OJF59_000612 [Cytophagales bacterium]
MNNSEIVQIKIRRVDKKVHYVVSLGTSRLLEKMRAKFANELQLEKLSSEQFLTLIIKKHKSQSNEI